MLSGDSNLIYPLPWAEIIANGFVSSPDEYKECLSQARFVVKAERNRREFALEFFAEMMKMMANAEGSPPLGFHILMGETRENK